jgi:hypothetical protein
VKPTKTHQSIRAGREKASLKRYEIEKDEEEGKGRQEQAKKEKKMFFI